jgi:hypothetical protein
MPLEGTQESHPYEPNGKRFVVQTLCRVISQAQSWDEVMIGCEALANALRISKGIESEALRVDSQAVAALGQLKELGREIRESQNGGSAAHAQQTPVEVHPHEDAQGAADHSDHRQAQKAANRKGEEKSS